MPPRPAEGYWLGFEIDIWLRPERINGFKPQDEDGQGE
jgi:hypothetical protein